MEYKVVPNIDAFNAYFHQSSCHPMVSIADLSQADLSLFEPTDFACYCVVLMESDYGEIIKGGSVLKYRAGAMFTFKPGEVIATRLKDGVRPRGKMLAFRPEMIENTGLGRDFYMFNFFDFEVPEALELDENERKVMLNCYANIDAELHAKNDELTNHMLRLGMGQMLSYCKRFYERQFDTRKLKSSDFIRRLDNLLEHYLSKGSELPRIYGYPTVSWCSEQFHLAPNYFGNLVRRDMHMSAQEFIHNKIIEKAKELIADRSYSIDDVADMLGFAYSNQE